MKLLKGFLENEEKLRVEIIYNLEAKENENIDKTTGVIVEKELDYPQKKKGINFIYYVNPQTKEQWYEEVERPLSSEEIQQEQNEKVDLILQMQMSMQGVI